MKKSVLVLVAASSALPLSCTLVPPPQMGDACQDAEIYIDAQGYEMGNFLDTTDPYYAHHQMTLACPVDYPKCEQKSDGTYFCRENCRSKEVFCDTNCLNPDNSQTHCGARGLCKDEDENSENWVGARCGRDQNCVDGECKCPGKNMVLCNDSCINPDDNRNFCGAKGLCNNPDPDSPDFEGKVCAPGYYCEEGKCKFDCPIGAHEKDGACVMDDSANCGGEGIACGEDELCSAGQCAANCSADEAKCIYEEKTVCVYPETNTTFCGANLSDCTNYKTCTETQVCKGGICTCNDGFHAYEDGCEANDNNHCGSHGAICDTSIIQNSIKVECATEGICKILACAEGYHIHDGKCEQDDVLNCGQHGKICDFPDNADPICTKGQCNFVCEIGFIKDESHTCIKENCKQGSTKCQDNKEDVGIMLTCEGNTWHELAPCDNSYSCNSTQTACSTVCRNNTKICSDGSDNIGKVRTCMKGEWSEETNCANNYSCTADGLCSTVCQNGTKRCYSDLPQFCKAGAWTNRECTTPDNSILACKNSGDCSYICEDGYTNNGVKCCANVINGHVVVDSSNTCSIKCDAGYNLNGNTCVQDPNYCENENAIRCVGNPGTIQKCTDHIWTQTSTCSGNSCKNSTTCGSCLNDNTRCNGNTPQVCSNGAWGNKSCNVPEHSTIACMNGGKCDFSCIEGYIRRGMGCALDPKYCENEGSTQCINPLGMIQTCTNHQWEQTSTCDGNSCKDNATCGICFNDNTQCNGNTPQVCSNGAWTDKFCNVPSNATLACKNNGECDFSCNGGYYSDGNSCIQNSDYCETEDDFLCTENPGIVYKCTNHSWELDHTCGGNSCLGIEFNECGECLNGNTDCIDNTPLVCESGAWTPQSCTIPANATLSCKNNGECDFKCETGYCRNNSSCVSLLTDSNNCGTCGHVCNRTTIPNATSFMCVSGECKATDCEIGYILNIDGTCTKATSCDDSDYIFYESHKTPETLAYCIRDYEQLEAMAIEINQGKPYPDNNNENAYILAAPIIIDSDKWPGIGTESAPFTGKFFGQNYDTTLKLSTPYDIAIFSKVEGAVIENIYYEVNYDMLQQQDSKEYYGGLVDFADKGSTFNYVSGVIYMIEKGKYIGGMIGKDSGSTIYECEVSGSIDVFGDYVGGIVGYATDSTFIHSKFTGGAIGGIITGGFVGYSNHSTLNRSVATGIVVGYGEITGGFIGHSQDDNFEGCVAINKVSGNSYTGGFIGIMDGGTATDCVSAGGMSGGEKSGGFVGKTDYFEEATDNKSPNLVSNYEYRSIEALTPYGYIIGLCNDANGSDNGYYKYDNDIKPIGDGDCEITVAYSTEDVNGVLNIYPELTNTYISAECDVDMSTDVGTSKIITTNMPFLDDVIDLVISTGVCKY